jgi:hypothetical protein
MAAIPVDSSSSGQKILKGTGSRHDISPGFFSLMKHLRLPKLLFQAQKYQDQNILERFYYSGLGIVSGEYVEVKNARTSAVDADPGGQK